MRVDRFARDEDDRPGSPPRSLCGVLVHVRPQDRHRIVDCLAALPGVEVHVVGDEGKLVLTVEDCEGVQAGPTIEGIGAIPGVLSVTLTYHHFDTEFEGGIVP